MSIYEPNFENTPELKEFLPCSYSEYSILYDRRGDILLVRYGPRYPRWHLKSLQIASPSRPRGDFHHAKVTYAERSIQKAVAENRINPDGINLICESAVELQA
jgi:hypothetical protein